MSPRPLGTSPAGGQGGILWLGRLREEKPPEICRQPFMELKAVQRNEPSFPQIMQGTVLARAPPRIAGPARSPSPPLPGPWEAGCVTWLGCRQRRSRAQRRCPRSGSCLRTGPASTPGLESQIPGHTWGKGGGMAQGDSAFHLQQHCGGGRGSSTPQPGPELLNLRGAAVCFSHRRGVGGSLKMRRACHSLKLVL